MAEATVLPSFPLPPPFFKLYAEDESGSRPQPPGPPPVPDGPVVVFAQSFDPDEPHVPPLLGRRLYQQLPDGSVDIKGELSRLNTEMIFVYSELLRVLVENPANYASPLNTLNQLMSNMQHLINMLRPIQACASLEYVLQLQVKEKTEALANLQTQVEAIDKAIAVAAKDLQEHCVSGSK